MRALTDGLAGLAVAGAMSLAAGCSCEGIAPLPAPACASLPPCGRRYCNQAGAAGLAAQMPMLGRGAAWIDFDRDGWEDLWLSDGGTSIPGYPQVSRLYRNLGDCTFEPYATGLAASDAFANWVGAWGDYDNDGDPDLFLANGSVVGPSHCTLLRNDVPRGGGFQNVTATAGILPQEERWWGASFADFDNDGHLDIVVTAISNATELIGWETVTAPILLYRNRGDGTFVEQAAALGLTRVTGNVKNPVWIDYDNDGDVDLFIAGMHEHRLYRNEAGRSFVDVTATTLPTLAEGPYTWAAAAADFDQDGWEDLYLGRWDRQDYLLRNRSDGTFEALGREIGLDMAVLPVTSENTMGLGVGDIDDDGDPDILIGPGRPEEAAPPIVYCNQGRPLRFARCGEDFVAGNGPSRHHGIALADFDHDGDTDLAYNLGGMPMPDAATGMLEFRDTAQQPALYVQAPPSPPQSAVIRLEGTTSNRSGFGARIVTEGGGERHFYVVFGTQGFQSQNSDWLPVRLAAPWGNITVTWPSGRVSSARVSVGSRLVITEP